MYGLQLSLELDAANRADRVEDQKPREGERRVNVAVDVSNGVSIEAAGFAIGETVSALTGVEFVRVKLPIGTVASSARIW